jgi:hypothetical protein
MERLRSTVKEKKYIDKKNKKEDWAEIFPI